MADANEATKPGNPRASAASVPAGVRRIAVIGAWLSGLGFVALVVSISAFVVDANRPPEPTRSGLTINGEQVTGERVKEALRDVGSGLLDKLTGQSAREGDAETQRSAGTEADGVTAIEVRDSPSGAERTFKWSLWGFIGLAVAGSICGVIARRKGARGGAVCVALWPVGLVFGLGMALPTCSV